MSYCQGCADSEQTIAALRKQLAEREKQLEGVRQHFGYGIVGERDELRSQNTALRERNAELEAQLAWMPIETAPKDGTVITGGWVGSKPFTASGTPIVWQNTPRRSGWFALSPTYENDRGEFFPGKWITEREYPTHWRPRDDPPQEQTK